MPTIIEKNEDGSKQTEISVQQYRKIKSYRREESSSDSEDETSMASRKKSKVIRERWTPLQKKCALKYFAKKIKSGESLRKEETEEFKNKNSELFKNKDWVKIKAFIFNEQKKKK